MRNLVKFCVNIYVSTPSLQAQTRRGMSSIAEHIYSSFTYFHLLMSELRVEQWIIFAFPAPVPTPHGGKKGEESTSQCSGLGLSLLKENGLGSFIPC